MGFFPPNLQIGPNLLYSLSLPPRIWSCTLIQKMGPQDQLTPRAAYRVWGEHKDGPGEGMVKWTGSAEADLIQWRK